MSFFVSVRSRELWSYKGQSSTSGNLSFRLEDNPFFTEYHIVVSCSNFDGEFAIGNITFNHISSDQSFFFDYILYHSSNFYKFEIWILPIGLYDINWKHNNGTPLYRFNGISFLYPYDNSLVIASLVGLVIVITILIQKK